MAGHAPFGAQVLLNGHEYVAVAAQAAGIGFTKEANCFTGSTDPTGLAQIADTLSQDAAAGRLGRVIDRWIYTACLCCGLDLADQQRTASATPTRSTRPSTPVTCCSPTAVTWTGCSTRCWTGPVPAGHPGLADLVRGPPPSRQVRHSPLAPGRGRARDTCVGPDGVQSPFRAADTQGLHQRRARPAVRGDHAQHQAAGLWPGPGALPRDRRPAGRHVPAVLHRAGLR